MGSSPVLVIWSGTCARPVRMAEEGADLILCDICAPVPQTGAAMATYEELSETADLVEQLDRRAVFGVADVRDRSALQAVVDEGLATFGHLDVVSASAGIWQPNFAPTPGLVALQQTATRSSASDARPRCCSTTSSANPSTREQLATVLLGTYQGPAAFI